MKFGFVAKHRGTWPVDVVCEALGVSRSGFYAWRTRPPSRRARTDARILVDVRASFLMSARIYGARHVLGDVRDVGHVCGRQHIARLMRGAALLAQHSGRGRSAAHGRSMQPTMTAQLVTEALTMGIWRRGAIDVLLLHSDRGSPYTSETFQQLLTQLGITCSMSRAGNVWDNAVMESFFSTLTTERTNLKHYATRNAARADVFDYIERFYNLLRRHSTLGNISPIAFARAAAVA